MKKNKTLTKLFGLIVIVCLLIAALPVGQVQAAIVHTVCAKGCTYTTIQAAIDAASDGDTIQLQEDLTIAEDDFMHSNGYAVMISGKSLTIDLNGHTLSSAGDATVYVGGTGNLLITDSGTNGKIENTKPDWGNAVGNYGDFTLVSGELNSLHGYALYNYHYEASSLFGKSTINGGKLISGVLAIANSGILIINNVETISGVNCDINNSGELILNTNLTIKNFVLKDGQHASTVTNKGSFTVATEAELNFLNGGTFTVMSGATINNYPEITIPTHGSYYHVYQDSVWIPNRVVKDLEPKPDEPYYTSIQEAINDVVDGDTILVGPGTYDEENIVITKGITLQGSGAEQTTIAPSAVTNNSTIVVQNPTGDVKIDGFTFVMQPKPNYGSAVVVSGTTIDIDSATVTIANNLVEGSDDGSKYDYGFYGQNNNAKLVITNNVINKTGDNPFTMENQMGTSIVSNNTVRITNSPDYNPYFSMVYGGRTVSTAQIVEGNTFYLDHDGSGYAEAITFDTAVNSSWAGNTLDTGYFSDIQIKDNFIYTGGAFARGIGLVDLSDDTGEGTITGAIISGNQIIGENITDDETYGITLRGDIQNTVIENNTINNIELGIWFRTGRGENTVCSTGTKIENNQFVNLGKFNAIEGSCNPVVDASPNWWGSVAGPVDGQVVGNATTIPWCGDQECTFFITTNEEGYLELPEGVDEEDIQSVINNAPEGATIIIPPGVYNNVGGFALDKPGVTIILKDGVVIQNNSPCFDITASNTTIKAETPGLATCLPSGLDNGINVDPELENIKIEGLNIDGSSTTGNGIDFAGAISDLYILNNYIHGFSGKGINFEAAPTGVYAIEGNLFKDNVGLDVDADSALDVSHNAWGSVTGPESPQTGWTYEPYTHVGLYLVPSESTVGPIQLVNDTSMSFDVMADLTNVFGLAFDLTFEADNFNVTGVPGLTTDFVGIISAETPTYGDMVAVDNTNGVISFDAMRPLTTSFSGTAHKLFTFTVNAKATGKDLPFAFSAEPEGFAMTGADYTNMIIPTAMTGETIDVIVLPELTTTLADTYFKGVAKEFTVTVSNPSDGGNFVDPYLSFEGFDDSLLDGTTIVEFYNGSTWEPVTDLTKFKSIDDIDPTDNPTYVFMVTFNETGSKSLEVKLHDADITVLDTATQSTTVYALPTLTSDDLGQDYYNTYPQEFTITVNNPIDGYAFSGTKLALSGFTGATTLEYWDGDSWEPLTLVDGKVDVLLTSITFSDDSVTPINFRVTFNDKGDYTLSAELVETTPFATLDGVLATLTEEVTANNTYAVTGSIAMQGRSVSGGVPVTLTHANETFGSWLVSTINQISNNLTFTNIPKGELIFTTDQPRYLNITDAYPKKFDLDENFTLPRLVLKGGNAVEDTVIDLLDAAKVGMEYGKSDAEGTNNGDVNFDKKINIQDLALVGGNYNLTEKSAYNGWSPDPLPAPVVGPEEGLVTLADGETFKLTVDADNVAGLYELEIDHDFGAPLPEFSVYASETDPYGGDGAQFVAAGVEVTYNESSQTWVIDFGTVITNQIKTNGITFYLVLIDDLGNQWGTMYGTSPENTFSYTFQ